MVHADSDTLGCVLSFPHSADGEDEADEEGGDEGVIEQGQTGTRLVDVEERNVGVVSWRYASFPSLLLCDGEG